MTEQQKESEVLIDIATGAAMICLIGFLFVKGASIVHTISTIIGFYVFGVASLYLGKVFRKWVTK